MKPRTVIITVEVVSAHTTAYLKKMATMAFECEAKQVQINVIKPTKKGK